MAFLKWQLNLESEAGMGKSKCSRDNFQIKFLFIIKQKSLNFKFTQSIEFFERGDFII